MTRLSLPLLLLLRPLLGLAGLPADWFVHASDKWKEGRHHAWFKDISDWYDTIYDPKMMRDLMPQIFRLRHAFVALKAVPDEHEARKAVKKAHARAMEGELDQSDVLDTELVKGALEKARGGEVPVDVSQVPELRKGGQFKGIEVGLGLAGTCDLKVRHGKIDTAWCRKQVREAWQDGKVIADAIKMGVRHIDSAYLYGTDWVLGKGWRASGVPREEIFLSTKIMPSPFLEVEGIDEPADYFEKQLEHLQTDFVDLLLFHHDDRSEHLIWKTWRRMEELQEEGKARALGVSDMGTYRMYKRCVKAGKCKQQRIVMQVEAMSCSRYTVEFHQNGVFQLMQDEGVELVQHTATVCEDEPVFAAISKELGGNNYYRAVLSWMQRSTSAALFAAKSLKHVKTNLEEPLPLNREQMAGLWGLSAIYSLTFCENSCSPGDVCGTVQGQWCPRGEYAKKLLFDPLGMRELYHGTTAPCMGKRPDWSADR